MAAALLVLVLAGCGGQRIVRGVYHAEKGYRVRIPSPDWDMVTKSRADLELRHTRERAAMLVNASCETATVQRELPALARQALLGLRARRLREQERVLVNGREAIRIVLDARMEDDGEPTRVELYVLKDDRCVYDFMFVAGPESFAAVRPDFQGFVQTFGNE